LPEPGEPGEEGPSDGGGEDEQPLDVFMGPRKDQSTPQGPASGRPEQGPPQRRAPEAAPPGEVLPPSSSSSEEEARGPGVPEEDEQQAEPGAGMGVLPWLALPALAGWRGGAARAEGDRRRRRPALE
jgi:hypothetical protein